MQRERITITIDADLLPAIDALIDSNTVRNRSHALEMAVRKGLSLHELTQVFFIYGEKEIDEATQKTLIKLLDTLELTHLYTIAPSSVFAEATTWQEKFTVQLKKPLTTQLLPADFGNAGALLLNQATIAPSFLIVQLDTLHHLPERILPAYSFHRTQNATVTHLVASDGTTFQPSGLSFAQAELLNSIPAGKATLSEHVFPTLVKAGKVSTYVYPLS
jgi:hypothetical protein